MFRKISVLALAVVVNSAIAVDIVSGFSKEQKPKAPQIQHNFAGNQLSLSYSGILNNGTITISGPNNYTLSKPFNRSYLSLDLVKGEKLADGRYFYQINANTGTKKLIRDHINNGRGEDDFTYAGSALTQSGSFVVKGGSVSVPQNIKEGSSNEW